MSKSSFYHIHVKESFCRRLWRVNVSCQRRTYQNICMQYHMLTRYRISKLSLCKLTPKTPFKLAKLRSKNLLKFGLLIQEIPLSIDTHHQDQSTADLLQLSDCTLLWCTYAPGGHPCANCFVILSLILTCLGGFK